MQDSLSPQVIASLIGVLVTAAIGFIGIIVNNKFQLSKIMAEHDLKVSQDSKIHRRLKLEELYDTFSQWQSDFEGMCLAHIGTKNQLVSDREAMDITLANRLSNPGAFQKIEMLHKIYASQLESEYKAVLDARDGISVLVGPEKGTLQQYNEDNRKFVGVCEDFKNKVAKIAASL